LLLKDWNALAQAATRPDDTPEPIRRRRKDSETWGGRFQKKLTAAITGAFDSAKAITAAAFLAEILDARAAPAEALDAANPYWDFSFDDGSGDDYTPPTEYPSLQL
jgi:hypothetical protein